MEGGVSGARAFTRFTQITGRHLGPLLLYIGTWFVLPFLRTRRAGAALFFLHWRGERSSWLRSLLDTYRCFLTFTLCWFERTYVFLHGPSAVALEVEGQAHVEAAIAAGKGIALLTAHFGNFELASWLLRRFGEVPVNVVMVDSELPALTAFMSQLRGAEQPRIIAINHSKLASLDLLAALRRSARARAVSRARGAVSTRTVSARASRRRGRHPDFLHAHRRVSLSLHALPAARFARHRPCGAGAGLRALARAASPAASAAVVQPL
jgi:predicted LPLAT superfamily acyltransferase